MSWHQGISLDEKKLNRTVGCCIRSWRTTTLPQEWHEWYSSLPRGALAVTNHLWAHERDRSPRIWGRTWQVHLMNIRMAGTHKRQVLSMKVEKSVKSPFDPISQRLEQREYRPYPLKEGLRRRRIDELWKKDRSSIFRLCNRCEDPQAEYEFYE